MRYAMARYRQQMRDTAYRIYDTECSQAIAMNTAKYGGSYINTKYSDVIRPKNRIDADDVIANVIKGAGLEVIK